MEIKTERGDINEEHGPESIGKILDNVSAEALKIQEEIRVLKQRKDVTPEDIESARIDNPTKTEQQAIIEDLRAEKNKK